MVFRTSAFVRSGSLQLRYTTAEGTAALEDRERHRTFEDTDCTIHVDHPFGVVRKRFGGWKSRFGTDYRKKRRTGITRTTASI